MYVCVGVCRYMCVTDMITQSAMLLPGVYNSAQGSHAAPGAARMLGGQYLTAKFTGITHITT